MNYSFPRENIPEPYVKIDWTDKLERTNKDYGPPERSNGPGVERRDELDLQEGWGATTPIY